MNIGEHIEPSAMRHADDRLPRSRAARRASGSVPSRDDRFATIEPEALGAAMICGPENILERLRPRSGAPESCACPRSVKSVWLRMPSMRSWIQDLLVRLLNVHVLDADIAAIGLFKRSHDLAQGRDLQPQHIIDEDRPVHVRFAETVCRGSSSGCGSASQGQADQDSHADARTR